MERDIRSKMQDRLRLTNSAECHAEPVEPCHAEAYYLLGLCFADGRGVRQNHGIATRMFLKAAEQGSVRAQFRLDWTFLQNVGFAQGDPETVSWSSVEERFQWRLQEAQEGDAGAQNNVGGCYTLGWGVTPDFFQAAEWCREAAEQELPEGQCNFGLCCANGHGVRRDQVEAVRWFRRAAEQGVGKAQYYLGLCYAQGWGVRRDYAEAVNWYRAAAKQGHVLAEFALDWYFCTDIKALQGGDVIRRLRMAAIRGDAKAQNDLAGCYVLGQGVAPDFAEALKFCQEAAAQGLAEAQNNLGVCYVSGHGVARNHARAFMWFRKSAVQGFAEGQCNLGGCYDFRRGVSRNCGEAIKWYRKAASQGHITAQYCLGFCYEHGQGVKRDLGKAFEWYRKAAAGGPTAARSDSERVSVQLAADKIGLMDSLRRV